MKLQNLLESVAVETIVGDTDKEIHSVTPDSRLAGPGTLFIAYRGVSADGNCFIADAISQGASAVIGERPATEILLPGSDTTYIQVLDGREALAWISAAWNGYPARSMVMVGITGTDGKTTTTSLLYHILRADGRRVGMISTVNAVIDDVPLETGLHTTTPDSPSIQRLLAQMRDAGTKVCVLETTSHGLAHHRVTGCEFDMAVVTNITHEHLDLHGTLEAYRAAKASLYGSLSRAYRKPGVAKTAVLNRDDSSYDYLRSYVADNHVTYGLHSGADVVAQGISQTGHLMSFDVSGLWGEFTIESGLVGEFNVSNILAAASAAMSLEVAPTAVAQGVWNMPGVPGRMERIDEGQAFAALVDFAHTPRSLEAALAAARQLTDNRLIVVFGCAGLRDVAKRPLMGQIATRLADYVILTAEDPRTESLDTILEQISVGCRDAGGVEWESFERVVDRGMAMARAVTLAEDGDVVIACGKGHEQSMCFGEIEYSWDDRAALKAALAGSSLQTLPTALTDK